MARLTRTERLGRQGIAFVEVDGVLARLTKGQSASVDKYSRAIQAVALAAPLAIEMRHRVRDERKPASGALPGYGRAPVLLSREYAAAAGLDKRSWRSSERMHAALPRRGAYDATGEMWAGLQARGSGRESAVIDFGGTSLGRGETKVERFSRGRTLLKVRPVRLRNSQKAGGILIHHRINIVEPTAGEVDQCAAVLIEAMARAWQVTVADAPTAIVDSAHGAMVQQIRAALTRDGARP